MKSVQNGHSISQETSGGAIKSNHALVINAHSRPSLANVKG